MTPPDRRADEPAIGLSDPARFAAVRLLARDAGYEEAEVLRRCEIPAMHAFRALRDGRTAAATLDDPFDALLRLFLDEEPLPWPTVRALLGDGAVDDLRALGLLDDAPGAPGQARGTVLLYPTHGLLLASDRTRRGDGAPPDDVVYPAITTSTAHFVGMLPADPVGDLLELCAGTGIAALLGARAGARAWATDVTERATHFARFNARLNGLDVAVSRGDLWEAVGDRVFDRVVAHPPYVAGGEVRVAFRDGGEDGEQVTRGIVQGLPAHLRPGGALHCTCAVTDRAGRPFEWRVRDWLGDAGHEFDVFFFPSAAHDPRHYFLERAIGGHDAWETLERRCALFAELGVERVVYGSFVVRRRAADAAGAPITLRRRATPAADAEAAERLIADETRLAALAASPGGERRLLDRPLAAGPAVTFALTHARDADGAWRPVACHVRVADGFVVDADVAPWIADLLARADGGRPLADVVRELCDEGLAPPELDPDELAALVRQLTGAGILREP